MARIADRNPESYTISVPQVLFSPLPDNGDLKYHCDYKALVDGFMGNTNMAGQVLNSFGNAVGTPKEIMKNFYIGALDSSSLGGEVTDLEHTVCSFGREETDRSIVIERSIDYTLTFDEPDQKNMNRFIVMTDADVGLSLTPLKITGKQFAATKNETVTVVSHTIADPAQAYDTIRALWVGGGAETVTPPNGTYGFIIGGDNTEDMKGDWEKKRQWLAYADFDFVAETGPGSPADPTGANGWTYMRPEGVTAVGGAANPTPVFPINSTVLSIPDTNPCVVSCAGVSEWAASAPLAWTGYGWLGADEGFYGISLVATAKSFKRVIGSALVVSLTTVGVSVLHIIPRASLLPEGNMDFNSDSWMQGQFRLSIQRDAKARLFDRSPAQAIPFGLVQTMRIPAADE